MTSTTDRRRQMIGSLCDDLNAQGWDQQNKLWFVKGDQDDEWLEYVGEFTTPPEYRLYDMIKGGEMASDATGVVLALEGWEYPQTLNDSFPTDKGLRAYWRLVPPSEHPHKVEVRQLLFASKDGAVFGVKYRHVKDRPLEWTILDASTASPIGNPFVDAARAVLGLNKSVADRVVAVSEEGERMAALANILDVVDDRVTGKIGSDEATVKLFRAMPEQYRSELVQTLPEQVRRELARLLTEDERRKYDL